MRAILFGLGVGMILAVSTPVFAHHSFSAEFDANQPITLKGTLTKMEWVNPHGWIHIDVKGPDGKVVQWAIETGSPNALLRRGLRKDDFPAGVELTVQGYRAKDGSHTANGRMVTTADGKNFFTGSSQGDSPKDNAEQAAPKGY
jgi:hypothetical protein